MIELEKRIREFMREIEYDHIHDQWVAKMVGLGFDKRVAQKIATEIGHIIEEYESTLVSIIKQLEKNTIDEIVIGIEDWATGVKEMRVHELIDPAQQLQEILDPYFPPDPDDEEDDT